MKCFYRSVFHYYFSTPKICNATEIYVSTPCEVCTLFFFIMVIVRDFVFLADSVMDVPNFPTQIYEEPILIISVEDAPNFNNGIIQYWLKYGA